MKSVYLNIDRLLVTIGKRSTRKYVWDDPKEYLAIAVDPKIPIETFILEVCTHATSKMFKGDTNEIQILFKNAKIMHKDVLDALIKDPIKLYPPDRKYACFFGTPLERDRIKLQKVVEDDHKEVARRLVFSSDTRYKTIVSYMVDKDNEYAKRKLIQIEVLKTKDDNKCKLSRDLRSVKYALTPLSKSIFNIVYLLQKRVRLIEQGEEADVYAALEKELNS